MPSLFKHSFRTNENVVYELELSWDDAAYAENEISFEVSASLTHEGDPRTRQPISASISVSKDESEEPIVFVHINGNEVFSIPLRDLIDSSQLIDMIPAQAYGFGDPICGCLIRSGLSAIAGQILECKNQTAGINWFRDRVRAISLCMKEHIPHIAAKSAFRAVRCIANVGLA